MLRDLCVGVKAVDQGKLLREGRRLDRQIRRTAAAEDHDVDLVRPLVDIGRADHRNVLRADLQRRGISSREDCLQFHIRVLTDGALDAASQVSVTVNTDANAHMRFSFLMLFCMISG